MATHLRTLIPILNFIIFFFGIPCYSITDTIKQGQQLRDWEQLNSANNLFRLQFFGPTTSKTRYLGIFYNLPSSDGGPSGGDDKAVWVANRNTPIPDASGNLMIDVDGKLKIFYAGSNAVVVFDSLPTRGNTAVTLLNTGNLVLSEVNANGSSNQVLWQSFDYPTDTLLPGMKLGMNLRTGHIWSLTSWISDELPASGSFTFGLDPNQTSQLKIWWRGNVSWMSGVWRNGRFANAARLSENFTYVSNEDETYFTYSFRYRNGSFPRYTMDREGNILQEQGGRAPFGYCFPSHVADTGCVVENSPECRTKNYWFFIRRQGVIYGDGIKFDESKNYSVFDCQAICTNDCSCVAYASTSYNKTGCQTWRKGRRFQATTNPLDLAYMVVEDKDSNWLIWLGVGLGVFAILLACSICYFVRRCKRRGKTIKRKNRRLGLGGLSSSEYSNINNHNNDENMGMDVHLFSYESIAIATNNFSSTNKLGEGGFGPVYKGRLLDGQEVAIKRLSRSSGQGVVEFKNEILLIAKLQHTNLVRLLGSSIKGVEKILVYEYMPNKSLDFFLFDPSKRGFLNWTDRFKIIEGIAQGLLYLHKYSRLRVIHRDLKASNILLDDSFNPKISDFGMARIFGINETEANTNRVVGTYGYMSPEYAIKGIVSMKTDVFSFGVLLLEIVSSKKNNSCFNLEHPLNLIGLAWKLWKEDRSLELMDPSLGDLFPQSEAMRCIQVGLLCVQDHPADRPSMSEVVSMLTNETKELSAPKQPAFFIESDRPEVSKGDRFESSSTNEITISVMEPR
ncbi:hypothetical protein LguiB_008323 [Lonicera macranthoides]